jgi:hypothetical protein
MSETRKLVAILVADVVGYSRLAATRGEDTKRNLKHVKELSPRGLECECTQKERSTSITKPLVSFHTGLSRQRERPGEALQKLRIEHQG